MSICDKLREELNEEYSRKDEIVDNLVSMDTNKPLSANQGVVIKELLDSLDPELVKGLASKDWVKMYIKQPFTLSLSVDNPFVVSGESFTLSATLLNSEGVGVYGEEVVLTGSDGSLFSAITNNQGVASFNLVMENTTNYIASYEGLSADCTVHKIIARDGAVTGDYDNSVWNIPSYRVVSDEWSSMTRTTANKWIVYNKTVLGTGWGLQLTIKATDYPSQDLFQVYNDDYSKSYLMLNENDLNITDTAILTITCTDTTISYSCTTGKTGTVQLTDDTFRFRIGATGTEGNTVQFREVVVYEL